MDRRSPIERMIDEATGYDPTFPPKKPSRRKLVTDRYQKAFNQVVDAAVAWHNSHLAHKPQKQIQLEKVVAKFLKAESTYANVLGKRKKSRRSV